MVHVNLSYIKEKGRDNYKVIERNIDLRDSPLRIGREEFNVSIYKGLDKIDEVGRDMTVSRKHLMVYQQGNNVCMEDLGSLNGTMVYIPGKGVYNLFTPRRPESAYGEYTICISPGEQAAIILNAGLRASELEKIVEKFKKVVSKHKGETIPTETLESLGLWSYTPKLYLLEAKK